MKQIDYYNLNNIVEIHITDRKINSNYTYYTEYVKRRFLIGSEIMRDIFKCIEYDWGDRSVSYETKKNVLAHTSWDNRRYTIIDNVVYERVKVFVKFQHKNSSGHIELFDTIQEANEWVENLLKQANLDNEVLRIN